MLTKIADDFYLDLDMLYMLLKGDDKYYFASHVCKTVTEITEERYLAIKNKLDELPRYITKR